MFVSLPVFDIHLRFFLFASFSLRVFSYRPDMFLPQSLWNAEESYLIPKLVLVIYNFIGIFGLGLQTKNVDGRCVNCGKKQRVRLQYQPQHLLLIKSSWVAAKIPVSCAGFMSRDLHA